MVQTFDPTFGITSFDPLLAIMHVPERELNRLVKGQRSDVTFDALPGERFSGRIERISPVLYAATCTFKVTVELRDRARRLKPGMFGRIRIVYDTHESTMLVPKEAVVAEDDAANVFVIRDSMSFRMPVSIGYEDDRYIEIVSGVDVGEQVITTGQSNLRDSSKVEVIDEDTL
jgi:RND family efflux transporter MFP subunit